MILIYRILTTILYPFFVILIYLRMLFDKEDKIRFKEKILISHFNVLKNKNCKLYWFHAASIGEMRSILPIIEEINKNQSKIEFLITTVTLSSGNLAKNELKKFKNVQHRYFPLDVGFIIKKFLFLWKPNAIFLVDSEIWPNLIIQAKNSKIPLGIINARITKKSIKKWMMIPKIANYLFKSLDLSLSCDQQTTNFLLELNVKNVFHTGNIKLIAESKSSRINDYNKDKLLSNKFWFAASTHKNEEIFCLKTHRLLKRNYENLITIIAPRHIERVYEIENICNQMKLTSQVLDEDKKIKDKKEIIIINSFGFLSGYYRLAKSVFIGKSIDKKFAAGGGQNPIDAANMGCKIYHGPYISNFEEVYEIFEKNGISEKVHNYDDLSKKLIEDLAGSKKNLERYSSVMQNLRLQTLAKTMKHINKFLFNEIS